ncbi:uncharacterized protein A4U43_C01F6860 [Asparagus officinalis]|uniref:Uncharacterized protein n=1 Tax=Asparagus officinalis TaxID=4686 RepID=A0A5P1FPZ0_ASPOF|nr:uncharacterized protein A4U43_C01F6860 [Asparagus officinalis]
MTRFNTRQTGKMEGERRQGTALRKPSSRGGAARPAVGPIRGPRASGTSQLRQVRRLEVWCGQPSTAGARRRTGSFTTWRAAYAMPRLPRRAQLPRPSSCLRCGRSVVIVNAVVFFVDRRGAKQGVD